MTRRCDRSDRTLFTPPSRVLKLTNFRAADGYCVGDVGQVMSVETAWLRMELSNGTKWSVVVL